MNATFWKQTLQQCFLAFEMQKLLLKQMFLTPINWQAFASAKCSWFQSQFSLPGWNSFARARSLLWSIMTRNSSEQLQASFGCRRLR